jgi:hypothetical protein
LKGHLKCLLTGPKKADQPQCSGARIETALVGSHLNGTTDDDLHAVFLTQACPEPGRRIPDNQTRISEERSALC